MHPMLNIAVKAARRGAAIINRAALDNEKLTITEKGLNDFVTEVDKAAEEAIIGVLHEAYPGHAFLAEESGASSNNNSQNEYVWIIDPLDGTTNFIHRFPTYCVSIALQQNGITTQAVIYDPNRNDLFTASKGSGAFLNNRRLRVTKTDKLANSLIGTGFARKDEKYIEENLKIIRCFMGNCHDLRRPGSAALDLAYVAAGSLDGFFEKGLKPWDIAAGALLVSESGGIVTDFSGEGKYLESGQVLAASPKIFAQMIGILSPFANT